MPVSTRYSDKSVARTNASRNVDRTAQATGRKNMGREGYELELFAYVLDCMRYMGPILHCSPDVTYNLNVLYDQGFREIYVKNASKKNSPQIFVAFETETMPLDLERSQLHFHDAISKCRYAILTSFTPSNLLGKAALHIARSQQDILVVRTHNARLGKWIELIQRCNPKIKLEAWEAI